MFKNLQEKFSRAYRRNGIKGFFTGPWNYSIRLLYEHKTFTFFKRDIRIPFDPYPLVMEHKFRELTKADILSVKFVSKGRYKYFLRYLSEGCRCFGTFHEDNVVGFHFVSFKTTRELKFGFPVELQPGQIYQFDGEIDRENRGKVLAISQCDNFFKVMIPLGYTETIAIVDQANKASYRFHTRLKFVPFKKGIYHRLFIFKWCSIKNWDENNIEQ